jgi:catechol 2,3-dioxygenase-like lactoylglutathione lyase family enzyme
VSGGVPARLSIVTLGVASLERSIAFYEALGWERASSSVPGVIAWFGLGGTHLGLFPRDELAADASIADPGPAPRFGGVTLAINLHSDAEVEAALVAARAAGASILKPAEMAIFGGLSGYFADPDGHPWEVAHNPGFPLDPEGRVTIP